MPADRAPNEAEESVEVSGTRSVSRPDMFGPPRIGPGVRAADRAPDAGERNGPPTVAEAREQLRYRVDGWCDQYTGHRLTERRVTLDDALDTLIAAARAEGARGERERIAQGVEGMDKPYGLGRDLVARAAVLALIRNERWSVASIVMCRKHGYTAVLIGGMRVTPSKCCGTWDYVQASWLVPGDDIERLVAEGIEEGAR